ncbi:putative te1b-like protein [Erysiphe necator]|uniref:Putative te1b-like protein n=1 Tax=Uncinula necator TaxID=52586 RepID=A0A0B1NYG8_UNCNE|nr:putative te1b-like protein [Erysiphe necator]
MQAQEWPNSIHRWTESFLRNRRVQVRFQDGVTDAKELVCGIPQGSPISPLLFLLYMAEPLRRGNTMAQFSYADDIGILGFGRTLLESPAAAQRAGSTSRHSLAQHMRRLNHVQRGASPKALITAVDACVVPVATYRAEVWCPGLLRPKANGYIKPPTSFHCGLIDKVLHMALRAALPVWRTTPNVVLQREGGIPPARILLEGYRLRLAARLNSLDDRHPLRTRASEICAYSDGSSDGPGRSSWGYVLQRGGTTFQKGNAVLYGGEVYDADIFGATIAFGTAISMKRNEEKIFILLDNQAAVLALQGNRH